MYGKVRINWKGTWKKPSNMKINIKATIPKIGKAIMLENLDITVGKIDVAIDIAGLEEHNIDRREITRWIEDEFTTSVTKELQELIRSLLYRVLNNSKRIASERLTIRST